MTDEEFARLVPPKAGEVVVGALGKVEMSIRTLEMILNRDEIMEIELRKIIKQYREATDLKK